MNFWEDPLHPSRWKEEHASPFKKCFVQRLALILVYTGIAREPSALRLWIHGDEGMSLGT